MSDVQKSKMQVRFDNKLEYVVFGMKQYIEIKYNIQMELYGIQGEITK